MEDDPAVTTVKTKSGAKQKFQSSLQSFAGKIESLENKYQELQKKLRKKSNGGSSRSSKENQKGSSIPMESNTQKGELNDTTTISNKSESKDVAPSKELVNMELYYFSPSPPCRAVMLFMHGLSLDPIMKEVDITKGENLKADYVKLNPQHTIPVIVDDGFVLSESRAILGYLAEQYGGSNGTYYPNDAKVRGVINQRLMFDMGTLYQRFIDAYVGMLLADEPTEPDEKKIMRLEEAFEFLEIFMGESEWMAGDEISIADYSLVATVSTVEACEFDLIQYSRVSNWLKRCKRHMNNYEEVNQRGANIFAQLLRESSKKPLNRL